MSASDAAQALYTRLLDALPQTQCKRCGYADCAGYAMAVAVGEAGINQCAPGGTEGVQRLSDITGIAVQPLNPDYGQEGPRTIAIVDEDWCIGCTLCITACPVDAIMGSNKRMHTVLEADCTGCELCLPVCPVDCIQLEVASGEKTGWEAWSRAQADQARVRYEKTKAARARDAAAQDAARIAKAQHKLEDLASHSQHTDPQVLDQKRQIIENALARARAQRT